MAARITRAEAERLRGKFPELDALLADNDRRALTAVGVPVCVRLEASPGRWLVTVRNWCPASDNVRARGVKRWIRARKIDRGVICDWLVQYARIPSATCRRRLEVYVEKRGPLIDPSNINKSLRDSLVWHALLKDDRSEWLEGVEPIVVPGKVTTTTIILTDLA